MTHRGFYERYFITPFFRKFHDFKSVETPRDRKLTLIAWLIATLGIGGLLIGLVGLLGPEVGFVTSEVLGAIWLAWSAFGICALFSRTSKGSGENSENKKEYVLLNIDKLLSLICAIFFLFGILMMATTLNSEELNLQPRNSGSQDDNPILNRDKVEEEPIFNYQDYDIKDAEEEVSPDTAAMPIGENGESYDESDYDPAATTPTAQDTTYIE